MGTSGLLIKLRDCFIARQQAIRNDGEVVRDCFIARQQAVREDRAFFAVLVVFLAVGVCIGRVHSNEKAELSLVNLSNEEISSLGITTRLKRKLADSQNLLEKNRNIPKGMGLAMEAAENARVDTRSSGTYAAANILLARGYFLEGSYSKSLKHAFLGVPADGKPKSLKSKALLLAGYSYLELGQPDKAVKIFKLIAGDPGAPGFIKEKARNLSPGPLFDDTSIVEERELR